MEYAALGPSFSRLNLLKMDLVGAYREEESFWQQKCRDKWVKEGDQNTRFFHASVKGNRSKNDLENLMDSEGNLKRSEASMGEVAAKYFDNLFTSASPSNPHNLLVDFETRVSDSMNELQRKRYTQLFSK